MLKGILLFERKELLTGLLKIAFSLLDFNFKILIYNSKLRF